MVGQGDTFATTAQTLPPRRFQRFHDRREKLPECKGTQAMIVELAVEFENRRPMRVIRTWWCKFNVDGEGLWALGHISVDPGAGRTALGLLHFEAGVPRDTRAVSGCPVLQISVTSRCVVLISWRRRDLEMPGAPCAVSWRKSREVSSACSQEGDM